MINFKQYAKENLVDMEPDDEETATKKIIAKALSEATLEAKYGDVDELQDVETEVCSQT